MCKKNPVAIGSDKLSIDVQSQNLVPSFLRVPAFTHCTQQSTNFHSEIVASVLRTINEDSSCKERFHESNWSCVNAVLCVHLTDLYDCVPYFNERFAARVFLLHCLAACVALILP